MTKKELFDLFDEITLEVMGTDLYKAKENFYQQAPKLLEDIFDRLDAIDECLEHLAKAAEEAVNLFSDLRQNREAVSSPLLVSPNKDEESSKEEEINPSIISPSSSEEKRREEERARKKALQLEQSFAEFWDAYAYKRGKPYAKTAWFNLTDEERKAAIEGIPAYKADCDRFGHQLCHPSTYLHQHRWEDEFDTGLEYTDAAIDGKRRNRSMRTREDYRQREREQRLAAMAGLAAEFRSGCAK